MTIPKLTHGGHRPGAGRPKLLGRVVATISVQLEQKHLDKLKAEQKPSKAQAVRAIIERA